MAVYDEYVKQQAGTAEGEAAPAAVKEEEKAEA